MKTKLAPGAFMPQRVHDTDAGYNIKAKLKINGR